MLSGSMVPSRRMVNRTVASNWLFDVPKLRIKVRTMFSVYHGYGKSMPGVLMFATSAPFPPVGPPPATGCGVVGFGASSLVGGAGVTCFGAGAVFVLTAGAFFGAGAGFTGAGGVFSAGGVTGGGVGCTAPIARSP